MSILPTIKPKRRAKPNHEHFEPLPSLNRMPNLKSKEMKRSQRQRREELNVEKDAIGTNIVRMSDTLFLLRQEVRKTRHEMFDGLDLRSRKDGLDHAA